MSLSFLHRLVLAIVLAGTFYSASADDAAKGGTRSTGEQATERQEPAKGVLRLLPGGAVTEHSIDTARGKLAYTATASTLAFYDQSGEQSAAVFCVIHPLLNPLQVGFEERCPQLTLYSLRQFLSQDLQHDFTDRFGKFE